MSSLFPFFAGAFRGTTGTYDFIREMLQIIAEREQLTPCFPRTR